MHAISKQAAVNTRRQYLSFRLAGLDYGLDFASVQELRPFSALEQLSSDGAVVKGVVMSRGVIMPIVDMRAAFGAPAGAPDPLTDVIILKLSSGVMGMVVDGVTDIVTVESATIATIPGTENVIDVAYLIGMVNTGGRRMILVDIDKLMSVRRAGLGEKQLA